jgi:uncharacterized radical SAM superfamily Fe-S cluster-containing enzyme
VLKGEASVGNIYAETISLCPICAKDCPAFYEEEPGGMFLVIECAEHGRFGELVEDDTSFFKEGYEREYEKALDHLVLPITYRCNLNCKYCYTLSNTSLELPEDKELDNLTAIFKTFDGNITLIGGEPTLRRDLFQLIEMAKDINRNRKISLGTNGQKLRDLRYVKRLKDSGLDFVFLSFNDIHYDESEAVYQNKMEALKNCLKMGMPVWLQRTIDDFSQLDSLFPVIEAYRRIVFNVTLRAVKRYGINYPLQEQCCPAGILHGQTLEGTAEIEQV